MMNPLASGLVWNVCFQFDEQLATKNARIAEIEAEVSRLQKQIEAIKDNSALMNEWRKERTRREELEAALADARNRALEDADGFGALINSVRIARMSERQGTPYTALPAIIDRNGGRLQVNPLAYRNERFWRACKQAQKAGLVTIKRVSANRAEVYKTKGEN